MVQDKDDELLDRIRSGVEITKDDITSNEGMVNVNEGINIYNYELNKKENNKNKKKNN